MLYDSNQLYRNAYVKIQEAINELIKIKEDKYVVGDINILLNRAQDKICSAMGLNKN